MNSITPSEDQTQSAVDQPALHQPQPTGQPPHSNGVDPPPHPDAANSTSNTPAPTAPATANADGGQPLTEAAQSQVRQGENQIVSPTVQAAQLEHTTSTTPAHFPAGTSNCALAGGNNPQSPISGSASNAVAPHGSNRRDNHISIRATDDEFDVIARRMERTGETLSEAVRAIIRESENKAGNVQLTPKAPPEQLEKALGELKKWRTAFHKARPRLNIATPADDDKRYAQVVEWRREAARLLAEIPQLEEVLLTALSAITSLTPQRVIQLNKGLILIANLKQRYIRDNKEYIAGYLQDLIDFLRDAGIKLKEK